MKKQITIQVWKLIARVSTIYFTFNIFLISTVFAQDGDDIIDKSREYRRTGKDIFLEGIEWLDMFAIAGFVVAGFIGYRNSQKNEEDGERPFNARSYAMKTVGGAIVYFLVSGGVKNWLSS